MGLNKKDLVIKVSSKLGYSQTEVSQVLQTTFYAIMEMLKEEPRLEIRNFGIFEVRTKKPRMGRNPRTGEAVHIPEKQKVYFKAGRDFKKVISE